MGGKWVKSLLNIAETVDIVLFSSIYSPIRIWLPPFVFSDIFLYKPLQERDFGETVIILQISKTGI